MPERRTRNRRRTGHARQATPPTFVVKVQLSVTTTASAQRVLIYDNGGRLVPYEAEADDAIKQVMGGRLKAYFRARVVSGTLSIESEAPDQDW